MKAAEFIGEFDDASFPQTVGPWLTMDAHDPPFAPYQLRSMARQGIIELEIDRYRLTAKAEKLRQQVAG